MASFINNIIVEIKKKEEYNKVVEKVLTLPPKSMISVLLISSLILLLMPIVFVPIILKFSITTLQTQT